MMGKVYSAGVYGVKAELIEVEADVTAGIPYFELTGNLSNTVKEAKDRVRMAIKNSYIKMNPSRIVVNLAPSNIRKSGPHFDLAMAISIMCAMGVVDNRKVENMLFVGELGLDGTVNPVNAVLPIIDCAREHRISTCVVPCRNAKEGTLLEGVKVIGVHSLKECIEYINGDILIEPVSNIEINEEICSFNKSFDDIKGQEGLKRALMIGAGAMHNILMIGPPGAGKTMAASRIPTIMPPMTREQIIEVSRIYSVAGLLDEDNFYVKKRPFRTPGSGITVSAFVGGGYNPIPGELSLAEHGVLFLDELNLFKTEVIESLRIPLETGKVMVNRLQGIYEYPARFMLVAAINPCKCGYYPDSRCTCSENDIARHLGKISRPIMDRIDMCVQAPKVGYEYVEKSTVKPGFSGEEMRQQIQKIQDIQNQRFEKFPYKYNSQIPINKIEYFCQMESDAKDLLKEVYNKYDLSVRAYHKLMKVARTIADLENHEIIEFSDIAEAFGYRITEVYDGK